MCSWLLVSGLLILAREDLLFENITVNFPSGNMVYKNDIDKVTESLRDEIMAIWVSPFDMWRIQALHKENISRKI